MFFSIVNIIYYVFSKDCIYAHMFCEWEKYLICMNPRVYMLEKKVCAFFLLPL